MSLPPGARLGPYEIGAPLGAGGMGEVYRAHDARLRRDVAIKILPDAFAADPDRLSRFEREAQLLASLHHPNIAGVYGLEESSGRRALVLELVDGQTLAESIAQERLPLEDVVAIAKQIATALEAAPSRRSPTDESSGGSHGSMGTSCSGQLPDRRTERQCSWSREESCRPSRLMMAYRSRSVAPTV